MRRTGFACLTAAAVIVAWAPSMAQVPGQCDMWVRKTPAAGGCQMFEFRSDFTAVPRGAVPSAIPKSAPPGFTGTGHQFGHQPSAARCSALVGDYARRYPISNVNPGQCYTVFSDGALVGSRP